MCKKAFERLSHEEWVGILNGNLGFNDFSFLRSAGTLHKDLSQVMGVAREG